MYIYVIIMDEFDGLSNYSYYFIFFTFKSYYFVSLHKSKCFWNNIQVNLMVLRQI